MERVPFDGGEVPLVVLEADLAAVMRNHGAQGLRSYARLIVDEGGVPAATVGRIVASLTSKE